MRTKSPKGPNGHRHVLTLADFTDENRDQIASSRSAAGTEHFDDELLQPMEGLHGYRQVLTSETMADEQWVALEASRPTAAELAADKWDDEPDAPTEAGRRSKLRFPFQA